MKDKAAASSAAAAGGRGRAYGSRGGKPKPDIPIVQSTGAEQAVSEEEFAELLKMAEQMKASKKKG
ncbi:hypothetical protein D1872_310380 [compost metagenome]